MKKNTYFEFFTPVKIISGTDALESMPYELTEKGGRNPLIITDKGISACGVLKTVTDILAPAKLNTGNIFDETPPDSDMKIVKELSLTYRENRCDSIIAVGGGSVIDTAKGIRILLSSGKENLHDIAGVNRIGPSGIPLFILPTTSGTGSEVTQVAVISDASRGEKMLFVSPYIYPDIAVLDPRLTLTLPPRLTAMTGMDALTHAIEAYSCLQKNPVSDAFASSAVRLVFSSLLTAVRNGKDAQSRLALANASLLAGIAFSNSMVGAVHAIGHACGAVVHVPHGLAMSVLLPEVMKFNLVRSGGSYGELFLHAAGEEAYASSAPSERGNMMIDAVIKLKKILGRECGLPEMFDAHEFNPLKIREVAAYAVNDGSMFTNPVEMNTSEIEFILKNCTSGEHHER